MDMEKQSYISTTQLISLLIMTRLPFSTAYFVALHAGRSIQDVLLAVPVNFILNFIVAVPILVLLKRHPGKDLVELAQNILGRAFGLFTAVFFMLYFFLLLVYYQGVFQDYYVNAIIPESKYFAIAIPLLIVAFYGAVKGIESIARFGGFVLIFYAIILAFITLSLLKQIRFSYLMPVFYQGPSIFLRAVLAGVNSNYQIVLLAFCAPFIRTGIRCGKIYTKWNWIASALFLALETLTIVVMGPFAAKQNYPLYTLSMQTEFSVFERLEAIDTISWIMNTALIVCVFLYLSSMCLVKAGLNKRRKSVTLIIAAACCIVSYFVAGNYVNLHKIPLSPYCTAVTLFGAVVLPLGILTADLIKGKVDENEKAS